jgi:hypothetical protein
MLKTKGRDLVHWFMLFTFMALATGTLQCCGSVTQSKEDPLQISLLLPAGEDSEYFWFGVQKKTLHITPEKGDVQELPWESGAKKDLDLKEGDKIAFLGSDNAGRLLVTGEATVGKEKKAAIALRRVL